MDSTRLDYNEQLYGESDIQCYSGFLSMWLNSSAFERNDWYLNDFPNMETDERKC